MVTSTILTLIVIPVIYEMWRGWQMRRAEGHPSQNEGVRGVAE
jgi:hypothetical protein